MGHWATWSAGRWPWNWVNFEVSSKLDWCVILWFLTLQRPTEEQARTSQQQQRCDEHQDENRKWETYSWLWLGLSSPSLEVHCALWQTRFNNLTPVTFVLEKFQISINNIHRGRIRAGEDGLFGNCNPIQGVVLDAPELATPSLLIVPEETALILKPQSLPLQLKTSLVTATSYHLSVILLVPKNL